MVITSGEIVMVNNKGMYMYDDIINLPLKPDNEQINYIIDAINDAINAGKQISFQ